MFSASLVFAGKTIDLEIGHMDCKGKPLLYFARARRFYLGHLFVRHCQATDVSPQKAVNRLAQALQTAWEGRCSIEVDSAYVRIRRSTSTSQFQKTTKFSRS